MKELREKAECARCVYNCGCIDEMAYKQGYNKAIDDFIAEIKAFQDQDEPLYNIFWDEIAEQLKAGDNNAD